jgi:ABC-type multidrug transport system ATPase subunit
MAHKPRLLLLDEPTAGLDPGMRDVFVEAIREARRLFAPAVLLTTHILQDVTELADRVAFLDAGRIRQKVRRSALSSASVVEATSQSVVVLDGVLHGKPVPLSNGRLALSYLVAHGGESVRDALEERGAQIIATRPASIDDWYRFVSGTFSASTRQ